MDCTGLQQVLINQNVTGINNNAFKNCTALKTVTFHKDIKLTNINEGAFDNCKSLNKFKIPSTVTTIGNYAFWNCDSMTAITIPDSVTSLGAAAFFNCDSLSEAVIGNGVTALSAKRNWTNTNWGIDGYEMGTFEGCVKLTSVTLGSGLISIDIDTFAGTQITALTVPAKVSELAEGAFAGAKQLKDIYFTGNWAAKAGGRLFEGLPADYKIHYIKNKIGYDTLTYNKATFTPITVTFDNNNDDVFAAITEDQIMSPKGGYVIEPIIPAASGYRFVGWYKDSKCTQKWNFESDKGTKNTTLYAKWDDVNKVKPVRPEELNSDAVTGNSISLTWQAVDGATSYNVYVDGNGNVTAADARIILRVSVDLEKIESYKK